MLPFRGSVRSPGLGVSAFGREVYGPGPHFLFRMNFTWIVVGLAGWVLALVFVLLLMRMAGQQDRAARHSEKRLDPFSDVTITKVEDPKVTNAYSDVPATKTTPETGGRPNGARPDGRSEGATPK